MKITRTVLLTAFSSLFLATPAFAQSPKHFAAAEPCDADALDGYYEWAAFHREDPGYFPEDEQAAPDADVQAEDGDEADEPGADSEEGEEFVPDVEGCADITVAPYDMLLRPLTDDAKPQAVDLRRRMRLPVRKNDLI